MNKVTILQWVLGVAGSAALLFILLITSFEAAAYSDFGFYEKEYEKYQVLDDVQMEMSDVMDVSREMMAYLKGKRDDLKVDTVVNGMEREFFNDREKAHMEDVRNLFLAGIQLRRIAIGIVIMTFGLLIFLKGDWKRILPRSFQVGTGVVFALFAIVVVLVATNFNKYFVIFHEIFFSNDLWLLDPNTDLLINILPEGFFADMAMRIGIFFAAGFVLLFAGSLIWSNKIKKN